MIRLKPPGHRHLGPGFEELFDQRALAREFSTRALDYSREVWIDVQYRDTKIGRKRLINTPKIPQPSPQ